MEEGNTESGLLSLGANRKMPIGRRFLRLAWNNAGLNETRGELRAIADLSVEKPTYAAIAEKLRHDPQHANVEAALDIAMMVATLIENQVLDVETRQNIANVLISKLMTANQGRIMFSVGDRMQHHTGISADIPEKLRLQIDRLTDDVQEAISQYKNSRIQYQEDLPHQHDL